MFPDVETLINESGASLNQIAYWQTIAFIIVISPLMAAIICALVGAFSSAVIISILSGLISYILLR